jgi:hypothetical protein
LSGLAIVESSTTISNLGKQLAGIDGVEKVLSQTDMKSAVLERPPKSDRKRQTTSAKGLNKLA